MKRLGLTAALLLLLCACGSAQEGSGCVDGAPQCQDEHTALFCDDGFYRAIPCRAGCTATTVGGQPVIECNAGSIVSGDECDENFAGLVGNCVREADGGVTGEICGGDIWRATPCATGCTPGVAGIGTVEDPGLCD